jgi:peptide-methionine (R)-S-oxide reductase
MQDEQTELTDQQWREKLTDQQYKVLRKQATERPFTGEFFNLFDDGLYHCAGCDAPLFESDTKFDAGCGWPSFNAPIESDAVATHSDRTLGMLRTEVVCKRCGGHLGHVFDDGPKPTGLRYCINSAALGFQPASSKRSENS